jgi:hypothetical protein
MTRPLLPGIGLVYTGRLTVRKLLERLCPVAIDKEVIVVDEGSTD